ncbi:MAG: RNA polymerase factor sigma-54 [Acidobacteria bacterium]|nr:RNA polymerase factor sigma-54 [Acidobacteriota bacterium]
MTLKQTINLKLQQKMAMTPALQQAIKLLQMTRMELEEELTQEVEKNPLLEDESLPSESSEDFLGGSTYEENEQRESSPEDLLGDKIDVEAYFEDYLETSQKYKGISYEYSEEGGLEENLATKSETLAEHLLWQVRMTNFSPEEMKIAEVIVGNIRNDGYLDEDLAAIAKETNCDYRTAEKVLFEIQKMDPVGVGARNLSECLLAQLNLLEPKPLLAIEIVKFHLEELSEGKSAEISQKMNKPIEEVEEAIKIIRNLDPKPGLLYSNTTNFAIIPDVIVEKVGNEYKVRLNDEGLPKLRLNRYYKLLIEKGGFENSPETVAYLKDKLRSAITFLKSVEERHKTVYNVACQLVEIQKDFLDKGPSYLKPLILREISERVGVHESTVSRVVANKYMLTPKGIISMKDFFATGIQTIEGKDISQQKVKSMIAKLIEEELPEKPLSDQQIVSILKREGILLARRTVAKYREDMKIPPSSQRGKKRLV